MNQFADQGSILDQKRVVIRKNDTAQTLYHKLISISKKQINFVTKSFLQDKIKLVKQMKKLEINGEGEPKKMGL